MTIKNWWENCLLREELDGKTPSQEEFVADIWKVRLGDALPVYQQQDIFFDRTYASPDLKKLVRFVLRRLSNLTGGKTIIRTQIAYGGGKSHAMLTVFHLCTLKPELFQNSTVKTFLEFSKIERPRKTKIAILPFDKFDVHEGLEVYGPNNEKKKVMTPWGALAFQLGGKNLFQRIIKHEKSGISPAQPIMEEILSYPHKNNESTLIIIDEASIYGRSLYMVGKFGPFKDFFQYLTQAASALENTVIVATLLHTGMERADAVGKRVLTELTQIFDRMGPETIEPIKHADVAEILRRRLFRKIPSEDERKQIVNRVIASWELIPNLSKIDREKYLEDRVYKSYPFHPDFIDVLYGRWIELPKFQRTRGALQLLSIILNDGRNRDQNVLIGPSCLLGPEDKEYSQGLSTLVDWTDDGATWSGILQHELELAKRLESQKLNIKNKEIEQLVVSTFLYSQPEGRKGQLNDILRLLIHPDLQEISSLRISIDEWKSKSWYFDDTLGEQELALIKKKNVVSIHDSIINSMTEEQLKEVVSLMEEYIGKNDWVPTHKKQFVKVHCLTRGPESIDDTPGIHLGILEPKPIQIINQKHVPDEISKLFNTTTLSGKARTFKNGLLVVVPDITHLPKLKEKCSSVVAWEILKKSADYKKLAKEQQSKITNMIKQEKKQILGMVRITYSTVFLFMPNEMIENRLLKHRMNLTHYEQIVEILRQEDRILEDLRSDKLLPNGGLMLWDKDAISLPIQFLINVFYRFPRLPFPESLNLIYQSILSLIEQGKIVLKITRPDNSVITYWKEKIESKLLNKETAELIQIKGAELNSINDDIILPNTTNTIWTPPIKDINFSHLLSKFDGILIPKLQSTKILEEKLVEMVKNKKLCLIIEDEAYCGDFSIKNQKIENSIITLPPPSVKINEVIQDAYDNNIWENNTAKVLDLVKFISERRKSPIPLSYLIEPLTNAMKSNKIELEPKTTPWPPKSNVDISSYRFNLVMKMKTEIIIDTQPKGESTTSEEVKSHKGEKIEPKDISEEEEKEIEETIPSPKLIVDLTPSIAELDDLNKLIEEIKNEGDFTWNLGIKLSLVKEDIDEKLLDKLNQILELYWPEHKFKRD